MVQHLRAFFLKALIISFLSIGVIQSVDEKATSSKQSLLQLDLSSVAIPLSDRCTNQ